jgi:predicted MPP superfamily phosphohydrolase
MILITSAVLILPYVYTAWRLTKAISLHFPDHSKPIFYAVLGFFIFIYLLPVIMGFAYLLGEYRSWFSYADSISVIDILLVYPFWLGLLIVLESFPYFLMSDLFLLLSRWSKWLQNLNLVKWIAVFKIFVFVFFFIYVLIRAAIDTRRIDLVTYEVPVKNIPAALTNINFVLSADVQIDPYTPKDKTLNFKKMIQQLNPDILFFAGDLVTSGTSYIDEGLEVLCQADAQLARIACLGDHDIWADANRISKGLKKCGWQFLDDQHQLVAYRDYQILVTGISYVYSKRIAPPRLEELLKNAPPADLKILLVHQPSPLVIEYASKYGYNLLLAGHTHGGQIVLKPFGIPLTPTQFENDFYSGMSLSGSMPVIVTNGIGMSIIPLRYRAGAEIVQFKFVSK